VEPLYKMANAPLAWHQVSSNTWFHRPCQ